MCAQNSIVIIIYVCNLTKRDFFLNLLFIIIIYCFYYYLLLFNDTWTFGLFFLFAFLFNQLLLGFLFPVKIPK